MGALAGFVEHNRTQAPWQVLLSMIGRGRLGRFLLSMIGHGRLGRFC